LHATESGPAAAPQASSRPGKDQAIWMPIQTHVLSNPSDFFRFRQATGKSLSSQPISSWSESFASTRYEPGRPLGISYGERSAATVLNLEKRCQHRNSYVYTVRRNFSLNRNELTIANLNIYQLVSDFARSHLRNLHLSAFRASCATTGKRSPSRVAGSLVSQVAEVAPLEHS